MKSSALLAFICHRSVCGENWEIMYLNAAIGIEEICFSGDTDIKKGAPATKLGVTILYFATILT